MCGKLGNSEVETLENMMSMAVYFVIADTFDLDVDEIQANSNLTKDLGMTKAKQIQLNDAIKDMFNDTSVDFSQVSTIGDVVKQIAKVQLH